MNRGVLAVFFLLFVSLAIAAPMQIIFYYGNGCPHCARMEPVVQDSLNTTFAGKNIGLVEKEIYFDSNNRQEMLNLFVRFGMDPAKAGIPTLLVDNRSLIIGEVSKQRFEDIITQHLNNKTVAAVYTEDSSSPIKINPPTEGLTIFTVIGAGLVDSVNPCTVAIMVMLLSTILLVDGRKKMLMASATFIGIIFICYFLAGLGILHLLATPVLTNTFYLVMTVATLLLTILEFNAYFNYRPGFFAVEMPLFLS